MPPYIEYAIQQLTPLCPSCGLYLDCTVAKGSIMPVPYQCSCGWTGLAVFFQRQRDFETKRLSEWIG